MTIETTINRPRRHRLYGAAWRLGGAGAAVYAYHYGYGEILAALIIMGTGLVAAAHDMVAATLRPKHHIVLVDSAGRVVSANR